MPFPEPRSNAGWADDDPGPVVRPYAVTSGRTRAAKGTFDLVSIITAIRSASALGPGHGPEQAAILRMCQRPLAVAEVAARLDLPLSVVRVLLGDLLHAELIVVRQPQSPDVPFSEETLEAMLDGLRSL